MSFDAREEPLLEEVEQKSNVDAMRVLFVSAAVLMILPLPWHKDFLAPLSPFLVIIFAAFLILFASLFDERTMWRVALADAVLSFLGFGLAAYAATFAPEGSILLTIVRQALAVVFAFALYTSGRTLVRALRMMHQEKQKAQTTSEEYHQQQPPLVP
jgi:hypothetical protein